MRKFLSISQNNSGGRWEAPAARVLVECETYEEGMQLAQEHISFCGDSGTYAEYDSCGCCPCSGHRWELPWSDDLKSGENCLPFLFSGMSSLIKGTKYMGGTYLALIKRDGSLTICDTRRKLADAKAYILQQEGAAA